MNIRQLRQISFSLILMALSLNFASCLGIFGQDHESAPGGSGVDEAQAREEASFAYFNRLDEHINLALENENQGYEHQIIRAYEGLPLDEAELDKLLNAATTSKNKDFDLIKLVRILYFTDEYDDLILPQIKDIQYWYVPGADKQNGHNSENHAIMWMACAYLLQQREGWEMDDQLEQRLFHYLELKNQYGFYEFFSSVYFPYTLSGLMNLADFAEDEELQKLAKGAVMRLLKDNSLFITNQGAYFPVAGRNYVPKYIDTYGHNHNKVLYLATGQGPKPTSPSHGTAFLATSLLDFGDVAYDWSDELDIEFTNGHTLSDALELNSHLDPYDQVVFNFTQGAYFHPDVADATIDWAGAMYGGAYTPDIFPEYDFSKYIPDGFGSLAATVGASFSRSSVISGAKVRLYKKKSSALTSLVNFWPGRYGYQQWPWVATVHDVAVFTQAGEVKKSFGDRSRDNAHTHLPLVEQDGNVALIIYRPHTELTFFNTDVTLYWDEDRYDETYQNGRWVMGRRENAYVAVYRPCTDSKQGWFACEGVNGRMMWAVVTGHESTHNSFAEFIATAEAAEIKTTYEFNFGLGAYNYYNRINVDGRSVSRSWLVKGTQAAGETLTNILDWFENLWNGLVNLFK